MNTVVSIRLSGTQLVAAVCTAQVLVQIGAFFWPVLLPSLMPMWQLTNSEAGWITAAFYGAYMFAGPILVTLTDRVETKLVYLLGVGCTIAGHLMFGFVADGFWSALWLRALAGMGWAGTYMTGVKLLADKVDEKLLSRAVAGHAASIGVSGAVSFACADLLARGLGWRSAFVIAGASAAVAWAIVALHTRQHPRPKPAEGGGLFDFRPVFRNRSAMAYAQAYGVHTLEMNALRGWGVAFLAFVAARSGGNEWQLTPAYVLTALGLIGTAASVFGNEIAIRFGRQRLITAAMGGSILVAACLGYVGSSSYAVAVALLLVYGFVVWLDYSSSLTAGAAGTGDPARRGATLAVHSSLGYAGGFIGPLIIGYTLDALGGESRIAWGVAFAIIAVPDARLANCISCAWPARAQRRTASERSA